jgi:hypothetical protein
MLNRVAIRDFKRRLRGQLLAPGDAAYGAPREVWNGMIDKRPALMGQRLTSSDAVQTGLKLGEFDQETQKHRLAMWPPPLSWWLSLLPQINYVSRTTNIWEYLMSLPRIPFVKVGFIGSRREAPPLKQAAGGFAMQGYTRLFLFIVLGSCLAAVTPASAWEEVGKVTTITPLNASENQHPEGVITDWEGNIYVGMYPTGAVWKITPDGRTDPDFASFSPELGNGYSLTGPGGGTGGMLGFAMDHDRGDLYVAIASLTAGTNGIWKRDRHGRKSLVAYLPPMTNPYNGYKGFGFPNGIVFDEEHNLYVADSWMSLIWKIDRFGTVTIWVQDPLLNYTGAYGFVGANNDAIDDGWLYVTNSDQASIVRIKLHDDGEPRRVELYAQSPALAGADGISFDREHNAYIDCYWVNTVVRVRPDRTIETLATAEHGLDFPADNAFDERWGEKKTLIWNNGGWNFEKPSVDAIDVGRRRAWVP